MIQPISFGVPSPSPCFLKHHRPNYTRPNEPKTIVNRGPVLFAQGNSIESRLGRTDAPLDCVVLQNEGEKKKKQ